MAPPAGELAHDAERGERFNGLGGGRVRHAGTCGKIVDVGDRRCLQVPEDAQGIGGAAAERLNALGVVTEEREQPVGGVHRAAGGLCHAFEKEVQPRLPFAVTTHGVEQAVVLVAVLLEVETQIQQRLPQYARLV